MFALLAGAVSAQDLLTSPEFHSRATGFAAQESAIYKVFAQAVAQGEQSRTLFQKCLKQGTPAAKLYGAIGLYHLDPKHGREALESLQSDQARVALFDGCLKVEQKVGTIAAGLLSDDKNSMNPEYFLP